MKTLTSNDRISTLQLCILLMMSMRLGAPNTNISYHTPYRYGFITNSAIALALTAAALIPILLLASKFPDRTLYEYSPELLGKVGGGILNALIILAAIGIASSEMRPTVSILRSYLLPETPVAVTTALIIATACYALRGGVNQIARSGEIFFVISAVCLAVVLIMAMPYIDLSFFSRHLGFTGVKKSAEASFSIFTSFFPMGILLFFTPFTKKRKLYLPVALAVGVVAVIFITLAATVESVFGTVMPSEMFSPLFELSKIIGNDTGLMPERSGIIFMVIYKLLPQFVSCAAALYIAALGIVSFFPQLNIGIAGVIASLCTYAMLIVPESSVEMIAIERFWDVVKFAFLPMSLILLGIFAIKTRRKAKECASAG